MVETFRKGMPGLEHSGRPVTHDSRDIRPMPIAVIGMALKFPQGMECADSFWEALSAGQSAWSPFPSSRLNATGIYDPDTERLNSFPVKGAHFIDGELGVFDAPFFKIGPGEAAEIDPQSRILLETTYHALENAGISMGSIANSNTSVYTAGSGDDYKTFSMKDPQFGGHYGASGLAACMLANRISWSFDLHGPSIHTGTACSSALVAMHEACKGIRSGESDLAIVAGANLFMNPDMTMFLNNQKFLSPEGRSLSFDRAANGYGRGEGFGAIILKSVEQALRDQDKIRAVMRATGVNQDGHTPGIVQPSRAAQADLIRQTYEKAGLDMASTRYIESHGTGTPVGDPIEAGGISDAFGSSIPLYVGSVKSNIGHLEDASAIASVIKSVLVLEQGVIPPIAGLNNINPTIALRYPNLEFPKASLSWPSEGLRRLSINSFGFGGTNAHVVMEDAESHLKTRPLPNTAVDLTPGLLDTPRLLVFSAQDEGGISRLKSAYNRHFAVGSYPSESSYLSQLAYTLSERRSALLWRSFAICLSTGCLRHGLELSTPMRVHTAPRLALCFTGQGAQWYAMGRELFKYDAYSRAFEASAAELKALGCNWDLVAELCREEHESRINDPELSQTLCTVMQLGIVDLLEAAGVRAAVAIGHSSGEIAAAYSAGFLDRRSAIRVAYYRGLLASRLARHERLHGSMLAVGVSDSQIKPYLYAVREKYGDQQIVVGCINSPRSLTITGDSEQIDYLKQLLDADNCFARILSVPVAYHSPHMEVISQEYYNSLENLVARSGTIASAMVSSVTGELVVSTEICQKRYWVDNMVSPVRFAVALEMAGSIRPIEDEPSGHEGSRQQLQFQDVLEIGPHATLRRQIKDTFAAEPTMGPAPGYTPALLRGVDAVETILNALGYLHCRGHRVDIQAINRMGSSSGFVMEPLVNLPKYPFDHSRSYWRESRLSRGNRFRQAPRQDFLGIRVIDWNPFQAKWRRRIKIAEDPWLQDHVISGATILPGAAIIAMAVEGVRSLLDGSPTAENVAGYKLKDVQFFRPVGIPEDTEGVEIEFYIYSPGKATDRDDGWREFHMYYMENTAWTEACRGHIRIVRTQHNSHVNHDVQTRLETESFAAELARARTSCHRVVKMDQVYNRLAADGIKFGPAHQAVTDAAYNDSLECCGRINLLSWMANTRRLSQTDFVIHPSSLDGLFHLGLVPMTDGGRRAVPCVMTGIQEIWISDRIRENEVIEALNKSKLFGQENASSNVIALDISGQETLFSATGLQAKFLRPNSVAPQEHRRLCWNFDTRPNIDLLSSEELQEYISESGSILRNPTHLDYEVKLLLYLCVLRMSEKLTETDVGKMPPHLRKYVSWMKREGEKLCHQKTFDVQIEPHMTDDDFYIDLLSRVESQDARGSFFAVIARNLEDILKGNSDALDLMFHSTLVKDYYRAHNKANNALLKSLTFLDLYAHKNPRMKVLEIGAGTGGMTKYVLDTLTKDGCGNPARGNPRFSHYTYTDISAGFFLPAASLFESLRDRVTFQVLDIEKSPTAQGFERGVYDIIIAENVLHATRDLNATLSNVRKLLKPEGKLVLLELTIPEAIRTGFAFGLLPGWWRFKDAHREFSALVSVDVWNSLLLKAGFSGVDVELTDYDDPIHHEYSAMISTAVVDDPPPQICLPRTAIIINEIDPVQVAVAETLSRMIQDMSAPQTVVTRLSDAAHLAGQGKWFFIIIIELGGSVIARMTEDSFGHFKQIFTGADGLLWVCRGGGSRPQLPDHAMIQGAFRGLRLEEHASKFITLSLETSTLDVSRIASKTLTVFQDVLTKSVDDCEQEYVERGGSLCVDRLIEGSYLNRQLSALSLEEEHGKRCFGDCDAVRLEISTPGLLDTLQFVDDPRRHETLAPDDIEIQVEACGVNFRDCLTALGRLPGDTLGLDCSGTVSRCGDTVTNLAVGDRVFAGALGTYQTFTRCKASHAITIPETMSFTEAAALPVVLNTAYYALVHVAKVQPGETVLIHSAAGGTGQAAIQVARLCKAEIFATVGSEEKKALLMDLYQITEDHMFDSRSTSFVKGIQRMTSGRGVDVALNSLSGDLLVETWQCMAPFGRFLELGKKDILQNGNLPLRPFGRNASFHAIDLITHLDRPDFLDRLRNEIAPLIAQGKLRSPQPLHVYGVGEIEQAFRYLQSGQNTGKTVVEMRREDIVKTRLKVQRSWGFNPNATYVIAGGLGGIGRSTARWMASRGAKSLLLLSRSREPNAEAKKMIQDIRAQGVRVETRSCDISDYASLQQTLEEIGQLMAPIKGCIQSAMVLRNKVFGNMTFQDWKLAVDPKVAGSWHLHRLLPRNMDFFIMYSSFAGAIGGTASVNYSAACAFQDALVHHRNSLGERATTLNLGLMLEDGVLRDNDTVRSLLMGTGMFIGITQKDMFALLEYHCNPSLEIPATPLQSQVLTGIVVPQNFVTRGSDVPIIMKRPLLSGTWNIQDAQDTQVASNDENGHADVVQQLTGIRSIHQAADVIAESLMHRLGKALGVPIKNLDISKPLNGYGVDSLVAVELRNWFQAKLDADVPVFEILAHKSFAQIGTFAAENSKVVDTMLEEAKGS